MRRAAFAAALLAATIARADPAPLALDLERGPLLACLERIALAAHVRIVDSTGRAGSLECAALRGDLTLEQALDHALAPLGIAWRRMEDGTIELVEPPRTAPAAPPSEPPPPKRPTVDLAPLEVVADPFDPSARPAHPTVSALAERAQALTRIDERWLETAPLLSFDQVGHYAPNLYGSGRGLAIRGFERDVDVVTALGVTLDGIDLGTQLLDDELVAVDELARIDLARGPRAFESGSGAAAGSIRLTTPDPSLAPTARVSVAAGEEGARRVGAMLSGPLGVDGLGGTLAVSRRELPDYIEQRAVPAAEHGGQRKDFARAKIVYTPEWLAGFTLQVSALNLTGDSSDRFVQSPSDPEGFDPLDRVSYAQTPLRARTHARGVAGAARYDSPYGFGMDVYASNTAIDSSGVELPLRQVERHNSEGRRRAGLSLRAPPLFGVSVVVGADRTDNDTDTRRVETKPVVPRYPPGNGYRIEPATDVVKDEPRLFSDRTRSAFVWSETTFGDAWRLGAGVRWIDEDATAIYRLDQHLTDPSCREIAPNGAETPCSAFVAQAHAEFSRSVDERIPVPLAVLEWRPSGTQSIALSHGRGYRSAGVASVGTLGEIVYAAEHDDTTELSWHAHWPSARLRTSATVFDGRVRDRFVRPIDVGQGFNSGTAKIRGVELEADTELGERWRARGGVGWLDSRYVEYRDQDGRRTSGAPPYTASFGVRYGADAGWYGSADLYRAGGAHTGILTSQPVDLPAYTLLDVRAGWRDAHWDAAIIATNALDADYIARVEPASPLRYRLGDPRHVELRVAFTW